MRVWPLLVLLGATPAWASHDWFGVDLCRSNPERMPPELAATDLPQPDSPGARLVASHCSQCHNLPGPGHHTADEWNQVVKNMIMLSEVTARFGGRPELMIPEADERTRILTYLKSHALRPLPEGADAPQAYLNACGDCHAPPDPGLHNANTWVSVIARMAGHRTIMAREPLDPLTATKVLSYLSENAAPLPRGSFMTGRWLALTPVFVLVAFALWLLVASMKHRSFHVKQRRSV